MHGYELQEATDAGDGIAELQIAASEDLVTSMATVSHALVRGALVRYDLLRQSHR
jgi:hypothetical protein